MKDVIYGVSFGLILVGIFTFIFPLGIHVEHMWERYLDRVIPIHSSTNEGCNDKS